MVFLGSWDVFDRYVDGARLDPTSEQWQAWFTTNLISRLGPWLDTEGEVPIYLVRLGCPATDTNRLGVGAC